MPPSDSILLKTKKSAPTCILLKRALSGMGKVEAPTRNIMRLETLGEKARPVLRRPEALKAWSEVPGRFPPKVLLEWMRSESPLARMVSKERRVRRESLRR